VAIGLLFASMPVGAKILLGVWGFQEAAAISIICFAIATYLYLMSRGRTLTIADGAEMMDRARRLAASGKMAKAIFVLTKTLRLDPKLWQALQYRGELRVSQGDYGGALDDFSEAIRLAPHERHLYLLRAQVHRAMGQESPAQHDYETASRIGDL
jgi:Flp pilus assembly protein TadD